MLVFGVCTLLVLLVVGWRRFPFLRQSWRRGNPRAKPNRRVIATPAAAPSAAVTSPAGAPAVSEPVAQAFPVQGLSPGAGATALRTRLMGVAGVTDAYVSTVTALAYVTFVPTEVSAPQLADAIRSEGYGVGSPSAWFDWLHRQQS